MTLSPELEARLRDLIAELLRANQTLNLTAIREPGEAWTRHIEDSLQALTTPHFESGKCVDVGAGAGFPGLPLALARPASKWTFLEATGKKCRFIESMIAHFGLEARVLNARAEEAGQRVEWRGRWQTATCRAVGSFAEVCELCLPLVKVGGRVVLWRGKDAPQEARDARHAIKTLGGALHDVTPYTLPGHDAPYHLVTVKKLAATPPLYPRRSGLPKQAPL